MAVDPLCNSKENIDRACKEATDIVKKLKAQQQPPQELVLNLETIVQHINMDDHEGGEFHHTGGGTGTG